MSLYEKIKEHFGHEIVVAVYGDLEDPVNAAVECETCGCVIVDEDRDVEEFDYDAEELEQGEAWDDDGFDDGEDDVEEYDTELLDDDFAWALQTAGYLVQSAREYLGLPFEQPENYTEKELDVYEMKVDDLMCGLENTEQLIDNLLSGTFDKELEGWQP